MKTGLEGLKDSPSAQKLLDESGALKISFKRGDVADPSTVLRARESIKEYLSGIDPEQVKALNLKAPEEYRALLKKMVSDLFPDGGDIELKNLTSASQNG